MRMCWLRGVWFYERLIFMHRLDILAGFLRSEGHAFGDRCPHWAFFANLFLHCFCTAGIATAFRLPLNQDEDD